jgi:CheY-like chemotaxis protein
MIDDNPLEHSIAKALFKHYGLFENSQHILDGETAMNLVEKNLQTGEQLPEVILLDLNMPHFSGWDFLKYFQHTKKGLRENIQIYILSSSVNPDDHEQAKAYSFVKSVFTKPLNLKKLRMIGQQPKQNQKVLLNGK